jgi:membrane protein implicated in regulation of membrane protease activity
MDAVTVTFLAIGCFSLILLGLSLVGGHIHFHLGHLHIGHGPSNGVHVTLPAIAGFLGMFGFAGAIAAVLSGATAGTAALLATAVGTAAGVPTAWLANRAMSAAMGMHTDATLSSADLVGATGVVISPVPAGGYGEVRLNVSGQPIKFNARADQPLARGTSVFVIEVPSPTSVLVEPTPGAITAPPSKEGQ